MIAQDVIFRIGSTGVGKASKDFAVAAAAVAAIGLALKKVIGDAVDFAQQWENLTISQRRGAAAMDKATKSLADTQVTFTAATKLSEAGLKAQPALMSAIGRMATDVSQKLGEGPKSLQARIIRLTDSIAKGQSRALKEYGIDLDETEDLLLAQAEAVEKVIVRAQGLTIEYQTLDERLFALNNNIDTSVGLSISWFGSLGPLQQALDGVNEHLGGMNDTIMRSNGAVYDLAFSFDFLAIKIAQLSQFMTGPVQRLLGIDTTATDSALKQAEQKLAEDAFLAAAPEDAFFQGPVLPGEKPGPVKGKKKTGGKSAVSESMNITDSEALGSAMQYDLDQAIGGLKTDIEVNVLAEIKQGLTDNIVAGGVTDTDIYDADLEGLAQIQNELKAVIETNEDRWIREQQIAEQERILNEQRTEFFRQDYAIRNQIVLSETEIMLGIEQEAVNESNRMWHMGLQSRMNMMQGFFGNLALLQHTKSKALFKIGQVAAIAEAGIQGSLAAVKAYQAMSGIPYFGPFLGALAAGSVLTYTGVQIASIKKQKYGGGSSPSASVPPPALGGGSSSFGEGDFGGGGKVIENTIIMDGQVVHESVMNVNDNNQQQGRRSLAVMG